MKRHNEKKLIFLLLIAGMMIFSNSLVTFETLISDSDECIYGTNYISVRFFDEAGNSMELNDGFIVIKADSTGTNPSRDLLLMFMIGIPLLIVISLLIYYGSKYYLKRRIDPSKKMELQKKKMEKKKQKYLSLADKYLEIKSSSQNGQIGETSVITIDAESQLIATPASTGKQSELSPPIETRKISVICPICKTNKRIIIPKTIIDEAKQLTTVSIAKDIVCEHHFQAFVDKNFVVRGYQKIDFHL